MLKLFYFQSHLVCLGTGFYLQFSPASFFVWEQQHSRPVFQVFDFFFRGRGIKSWIFENKILSFPTGFLFVCVFFLDPSLANSGTKWYDVPLFVSWHNRIGGDRHCHSPQGLSFLQGPSFLYEPSFPRKRESLPYTERLPCFKAQSQRGTLVRDGIPWTLMARLFGQAFNKMY